MTENLTAAFRFFYHCLVHPCQRCNADSHCQHVLPAQLSARTTLLDNQIPDEHDIIKKPEAQYNKEWSPIDKLVDELYELIPEKTAIMGK